MGARGRDAAIASLYACCPRLCGYKTVVTGSGDQGGVARYLYPTTEPAGVYKIRCEFYGDAWLEPGYGKANLTVY